MLKTILAYFVPDFRRGHFFDFRLWVLLVPAFLVLSTDLPVLLTLLYSMSAILVVVAMAHTVRRILFHYVNLGVMVAKAVETPLGAAVIFLDVCFVTSSVVLATALWIGR